MDETEILLSCRKSMGKLYPWEESWGSTKASGDTEWSSSNRSRVQTSFVITGNYIPFALLSNLHCTEDAHLKQMYLVTLLCYAVLYGPHLWILSDLLHSPAISGKVPVLYRPPDVPAQTAPGVLHPSRIIQPLIVGSSEFEVYISWQWTCLKKLLCNH